MPITNIIIILIGILRRFAPQDDSFVILSKPPVILSKPPVILSEAKNLLKLCILRCTGEGNDVTDVGHAGYKEEEPLKAKTESGVGD